MANVDKQSSLGSRPMVGGDGANSYANNSAYQGGAAKAAMELIKQGVLDKLEITKILGLHGDRTGSGTFRIADFGCSTGPNTLIAVQNIIEFVELKFRNEKPAALSAIEFHVFFNDHSDNDFNTLFKSLPQSRNYFAAGVPGSFYSRLFPKSTLHLAFSSYTLHWLSKIPKLDLDVQIGGSIQTRRFAKEVMEAYAAQFSNDFNTFLNARAEELVPGGLAALVIFCMPDGIPLADNAAGGFFKLFGSCLVDLATMGILSEERVKSFDMPMHNPTPEQLEGIIKRNGKFRMERMERIVNPEQKVIFTARGCALSTRSIYGALVEDHFGVQFVDPIFNYFGEKVEEMITVIAQRAQQDITDLFILLHRL